jgi:PAS domain S-box-containing protein
MSPDQGNSKEQFRTLFEAMEQGVVYQDTEGRIVEVNPAAERILGLSRDQIMGRTSLDPCWKTLREDGSELPGEQHPAMITLRTGQPVRNTVMGVHLPTDEIRWIMVSSIVEKGKDGTLQHVIATITDISALKRAEAVLRESEARFKALSEASFGGVIIHDKGLILECNQGLSDMTGFSHEELVGMNGLNLIAPDSLDTVVRNIRRGYDQRYEVEGVRKDGSVYPLSIQGKNVTQKGLPVRVIEFRDITERKRAEDERMYMEKQLLHAQKLESLGVLAGGIAHDFNNILMAIMGNADLALMRINRESPAVDNLHKIEQSAARAADLARQMLAYSGKGKFVIENIDLNRLLEDMLHMLEVSISKKAVLRLNPYHPLPSVEADATQIRQIIMNLVINASEAIGDRSGVIAITTGCMDCDNGYLKDVWLDENISEGLYVYLEIADTGCGMDKDTLAKLFDPFFTTKFTGRGLGMAAVLGIVRGHKGAIKVYSEAGKGTSFKILLPASDRPTELFNGVATRDNWLGNGTVLLVDDEETVRGIGSEMLKELGFTAVTANDGREALEIFKNRPDISFVILDLTMPHVDGEQCFRELRRMNPNIKVIMSSGYNEQEVTQRFVGKGLAGFIQKPYKLSVLKDAIRGMLP